MTGRRVISALLGACLGSFALATPAFASEPAPGQDNPKTSGPLVAHLASYRSKAQAEQAWLKLADNYSSILYFQPLVYQISLDKKGEYWRVTAEGDEALVRSLCRSMQAQKLYCLLMDREGTFLHGKP